jgi:hypothetical protein
MPALVTLTNGTRPAVGQPARTKFFCYTQGFLLLIVIAGFTRTFYLRPYFGLPPLPWLLYVHGSILTAWMVFALTQTLLIGSRRTRLHRRLGIAGAVLAIAVVVVSVATLADREVPFIDEAPRRAFGQLNSVVIFSLYVTSGIALRRRSAAHKRLMLMASIPLAAPAVARIPQTPPLSQLFTTVFGDARPAIVVAAPITLLLVASVVVHDLASARRVHGATAWGLLCFFALGPAITAAMMFSGAWADLVHLVGHLRAPA